MAFIHLEGLDGISTPNDFFEFIFLSLSSHSHTRVYNNNGKISSEIRNKCHESLNFNLIKHKSMLVGAKRI